MTVQRQVASVGSGLLHPGWSLGLPLLAFTVAIVSPPERRLVSVLWVAPLFALMQWVVPKCRFRTEHYFSPINVALLMFVLKIVIAPLMVMAVGPANDLFIGIPSRSSMNGAVVIDAIAYIALCLGLAFTPLPGSLHRSPPFLAPFLEPPSMTIVFIFSAIGLLGFGLAFGSPGRLIQYFLEPRAAAEIAQDYQGNWSGYLGIILRPFFAFALVAWWTRFIDHAGTVRPWRTARLGMLAVVGITLANLTFSFNRAAFVFPIVCLVAVYSARTRHIPPLATASALAVVLPLLMLLGSYRANMLAPVTAPPQNNPFANTLRSMSETVQLYTGSPSLAGLFFEQQGWGDHLYGGSTLVASALSPVPVLGKAFRGAPNGSALYNAALYGQAGYDDQIIPLSAELFVNFHAVGVAAGFFALGSALGWAQCWFTVVGSAFGAFVIQYSFFWISLLSVWSLGIVSQIALYFWWPVYAYWAAMQARFWLRGMRRHRVAISYS